MSCDISLFEILNQCGYSPLWENIQPDEIQLNDSSNHGEGGHEESNSRTSVSKKDCDNCYVEDRDNSKESDNTPGMLAESIGVKREIISLDIWRPSVGLPLRRVEPTDWSSLKHQGGDWEVIEFTGGATTRRDPRRLAHEYTSSSTEEIQSCHELKKEILDSYTPRQKQLYKSLNPPEDITEEPLASTPSVETEILQGLSPRKRREVVKAMFKEFVVELTRGAFFTQLTSSRDYVTLFCQLMENLEALTLDQNSGRRIEFPLKDIQKIYSLLRPHRPPATSGDNTHPYLSQPSQASMNGLVPKLNLSQLFDSDHLVILEFSARKLAFVFRDEVEADRFKFCMKMLVKYISHDQMQEESCQNRCPVTNFWRALCFSKSRCCQCSEEVSVFRRRACRSSCCCKNNDEAAIATQEHNRHDRQRQQFTILPENTPEIHSSINHQFNDQQVSNLDTSQHRRFFSAQTNDVMNRFNHSTIHSNPDPCDVASCNSVRSGFRLGQHMSPVLRRFDTKPEPFAHHPQAVTVFSLFNPTSDYPRTETPNFYVLEPSSPRNNLSLFKTLPPISYVSDEKLNWLLTTKQSSSPVSEVSSESFLDQHSDILQDPSLSVRSQEHWAAPPPISAACSNRFLIWKESQSQCSNMNASLYEQRGASTSVTVDDETTFDVASKSSLNSYNSATSKEFEDINKNDPTPLHTSSSIHLRLNTTDTRIMISENDDLLTKTLVSKEDERLITTDLVSEPLLSCRVKYHVRSTNKISHVKTILKTSQQLLNDDGQANEQYVFKDDEGSICSGVAMDAAELIREEINLTLLS